jgi:hypothetical protein
VVCADGPCGSVATPLFPPDCRDPDFLVVQLGGRTRPRQLMIPAGLVQAIDPGTQVVRISATNDELKSLPEVLPLAW